MPRATLFFAGRSVLICGCCVFFTPVRWLFGFAGPCRSAAGGGGGRVFRLGRFRPAPHPALCPAAPEKPPFKQEASTSRGEESEDEWGPNGGSSAVASVRGLDAEGSSGSDRDLEDDGDYSTEGEDHELGGAPLACSGTLVTSLLPTHNPPPIFPHSKSMTQTKKLLGSLVTSGVGGWVCGWVRAEHPLWGGDWAERAQSFFFLCYVRSDESFLSPQIDPPPPESGEKSPQGS